MSAIELKRALHRFPNISKYKMSSEDFALSLLKEQKVVVVPGTAFGDIGEGYIRIFYAYSIEDLKEALNRIEEYVSKIS